MMGGFFERFAAVFIDGVLVLIVMVIIGTILGVVFGSLFAVSATPAIMIDRAEPVGPEAINGLMNSMRVVNSLSYLIGFVLVSLYYGYFYSKNGQTIGKKVMKLKVVREDNMQYVSFLRAVARDVFGKWVSGMLLGLGYFWYFMSQKRQTFHDMIVSTYVVKTDDAGNILMVGPALYPKEPVKTFLPCGCCVLFPISAIVGITMLAAVNPAKQMQKANQQRLLQEQTQQNWDKQYNDAQRSLPGAGGATGTGQKEQMTPEEFTQFMKDLNAQMEKTNKELEKGTNTLQR